MLSQSEQKEFWSKRADSLKARAVGFGNMNINQQDQIYKIVQRFILKYAERGFSTLEYGCGIGRYAKKFENYVGVDMTKQLIDIAKAAHPDKSFYRIGPILPDGFKETLDELNFDVEQILTATVLQHCDDESVKAIFASFKDHNIAAPFILTMYENSEPFEKPHVIGRNSQDYLELIKTSGLKLNTAYPVISHTHTVNREKHTLTIVGIE